MDLVRRCTQGKEAVAGPADRNNESWVNLNNSSDSETKEAPSYQVKERGKAEKESDNGKGE